MLIDPLRHTSSTAWDRPRRRPRYVARIAIRRKAVQPRPAPVEPLSCWHVWLTDGLVPTGGAPAEAFGAIFARAEAIAAERAAAYRAHTAPELPPGGLRLDLRA